MGFLRSSAAPSPSGGLGHRAARGRLMMLAQNVVARGCGIGSQMALAALLAPADFGIISLTYTVSNIATVLVNVGITVGLAYAGFGAYSFAIPVPMVAALRTAVFWRLARPRMAFRPHLQRWRHVLGSTGATFATRLLVTTMNQGDYMVLGLLASHAEVGRYYFGFRLSAQPLWILAGNFANVLMPALVHLKSDPQRQGQAALRASTLLSFCVMPLAFLQAAIAGPLLTFFFHEKWAASIPVVQLLSIGLAMDAVSWVAGALMSARGEFNITLRYIAVQTPIFFAMVWTGAVLRGALGVAVAVALFYTMTQPFFVAGAFRRVGVPASQVAWLYLLPGALAAAAVGTGLAISRLPPLAGHPLPGCAVILLAGGPLYLAGALLCAPDVVREVYARALGAFGKHAPA